MSQKKGRPAPAAPEAEAEKKAEEQTEAAAEEKSAEKAAEAAAETAGEAPEAEAPKEEAAGEADEAEELRAQLAQKDDQYLRLAAEYDNYRKRTAREKDAIWTNARADAVQALLPVYDNLERAVRAETADEAYKKGVEMTMTQLKEAFASLGVEEIPALGEAFDPNVHNAVMHVDDEGLGQNVVAEVLQAGFRCGGKVIRCAMVKVAN